MLLISDRSWEVMPVLHVEHVLCMRLGITADLQDVTVKNPATDLGRPEAECCLTAQMHLKRQFDHAQPYGMAHRLTFMRTSTTSPLADSLSGACMVAA